MTTVQYMAGWSLAEASLSLPQSGVVSAVVVCQGALDNETPNITIERADNWPSPLF